MRLMKNQSPESGRGIYTKAQELIKRYPGTFGVAAFALYVFANRLSGPLSDGQSDAKPKAPVATAAPFGAAKSDWEPKFSVITTDGIVLDLACHGTSEIVVHTGDTLTSIAADVETVQLGQDLPQLSNESIVKMLADVNNVKDPDLIYQGQSLVKPDQCAVMGADAN